MLDKYSLTFGMSFKEIIEKIRLSRDCQIEESEKQLPPTPSDIPSEKIKPLSNEPQEETVILTKKMIEDARAPNGGFTKSQLTAKGVGWPPPPDWIDKKAGTRISTKQLEVFNQIHYISKPSASMFSSGGSKTYKDVVLNHAEQQKIEAILQAMSHFYVPATPKDIARTISRTAWGENVIREDTVDSFLKLLPEVDYIQWGKYILKSRNKESHNP